MRVRAAVIRQSRSGSHSALQMGALRARRLRAIRRKWKYTIMLVALLGVFWLTAGPWLVASSDQQPIAPPIAHTLPTVIIPWHPSHHARLTHAGMQISAFQHHWADPRVYKRRQKYYLAEPLAQPACTAWSANRFLALSLLYVFGAAPALAWIAWSGQHQLQLLAVATCFYFMAEQLLKHPLQPFPRDQPSAFLTTLNRMALPVHRLQYALTCLLWGIINHPAVMGQLQNMLGWLAGYSCITLLAERYLTNVRVSAVLSNKWYCRLSWCCRTAAMLLILSMHSCSEYASAKLIVMLLIIAGIEQNPGPPRKTQQSQQGRSVEMCVCV